MTLFKSALSHLSRKSTPAVAINKSLNSWCYDRSCTDSTRFVHTIEMCTALTAGDDAWGMPVGKNHQHTLLRVSLVPTTTGSDASEDTLLIERVLSTGGAFHSVTPISDTLSSGGTLLHPEVHDRLCAISEGSSTTVAHGLVVERSLAFGDGVLTLAQLAQILNFVSRTTGLICDGGDCRFQSRSFAFTCLAAMAPTVPPREAGQGQASTVSSGSEVIDDSVFELTAEAFLAQAWWLVGDAASIQTLELIGTLKEEPQDKVRARLYH